MKKTQLIFLFLMGAFMLNAQERYLDEVFSNVKESPNLIYGNNATILYQQTLGQAVPEDLLLDVYEPEGDTETARPLVLMFHTGNFAPTLLNGGCTGTRKDADLVNMAKRLARMGYVVASVDYRLGWAPTNLDQNVRVYTLINAAYRGVQDAHTAIRYFKKTIAENSNPYGIDPEKIAIWGNGAGGYITYATATLDTITDTFLPKFTIAGLGSMVKEPINGDVHGTKVGIVPPNFPFGAAGDTLCYPNHEEYDSEVKLSVSLGGALGDVSWIDANDPPMIGMQVTTDPFAPYNVGDVVVPPPFNLTVVEVMGSGVAIHYGDSLGTQTIIDHPFIDPVSVHANTASQGVPGLYPFFSTDPTEGSPWNYANSLEPYGVTGSNCDTNSVAANVFIDTIMQFFAPRACLALDLGCNLTGYSATNDRLDAAQVGLEISPNPASEFVRFKTEKGFPIQHIYVYDMNGRLVKAHSNIKQNLFTMQRHSLAHGTYFAKVMFENGFVTEQVMFR